MKLAIIVLVALNVALLVAWSGAFGPIAGDAREPDRLARQVRPERIRIVQTGAAVANASSAATAPASAPQAQGQGEAASSAPTSGPAVSIESAPPAPASSPAATAAAAPASPVPVPAPASRPAPAPTQASACIEWGPFVEGDVQHARMAAEQAGAQVEPVLRAFEPKAFQVYVPPAADQAAARARAAQLERAGIEAYVIAGGPYRWGLSLGVFRKEQSALALQRQLHGRGVTDARIDVRGSERWALRLRGVEALAHGWRGPLSAKFPGRAFGACAA